jgi:hypothetical protein
VEGRDLSSRQMQQVVKDLEIGQPINSENCSETAEGVNRAMIAAGWSYCLRTILLYQPQK